MAAPDYSAYQDTQPNEDALARLTRLAHQQREAEQAVEQAEEALKLAKERLRTLSEQHIPELMDQVGVKTFTTRDGVEITLGDELYLSVPKHSKAEAMAWVEEHGGEALVKRVFAIVFDKGQEKLVAKFERDLKRRKTPLQCERSADVHSSTLKKFLKDQLAEGVAVPLETFGARQVRRAIVEVKG